MRPGEARHGPLSTRDPLDYLSLPNRAQQSLQTKCTSIVKTHGSYTALRVKAGSSSVAVVGGLAGPRGGGDPVAAAAVLVLRHCLCPRVIVGPGASIPEYGGISIHQLLQPTDSLCDATASKTRS